MDGAYAPGLGFPAQKQGPQFASWKYVLLSKRLLLASAVRLVHASVVHLVANRPDWLTPAQGCTRTYCGPSSRGWAVKRGVSAVYHRVLYPGLRRIGFTNSELL